MRALLPLTLLLVACGPSLTVDVLEPAEIPLPHHVEHVVVVDAAGPRNLGQEILSGVEGALTGEGLLADRDARRDALDEVVASLRASPRYTVVPSPVALQDGTIWDRELDPGLVADLAWAHDADAVLALQALDSDSDLLDVSRLLEADSEAEVAAELALYIARRETTVVTAWQVYDARGHALDRVREIRVGSVLDAEGETWEEAVAGLPDGRSVVRGLALDAARDYGARIAPHWIQVERPLHRGGPDLEAGVQAAQAGDHALARERWLRAAADTDLEIAGRALHNLAVLAEAEGALGEALEHARQADRHLRTGASADYAAELAWMVEAHGPWLPR
jgi:hypothetical protein